jgi:hypothetical protein
MLRSYASTNNFDNSNLVGAELEPPSESESVRARVPGTLSPPQQDIIVKVPLANIRRF